MAFILHFKCPMKVGINGKYKLIIICMMLYSTLKECTSGEKTVEVMCLEEVVANDSASKKADRICLYSSSFCG